MILEINREAERKAVTFGGGAFSAWNIENQDKPFTVTFDGKPEGDFIGAIGALKIRLVDGVVTYFAGKNIFADAKAKGYTFKVDGNTINGVDVGLNLYSIPVICAGKGFTAVKLDANDSKRKKSPTG